MLQDSTLVRRINNVEAVDTTITIIVEATLTQTSMRGMFANGQSAIASLSSARKDPDGDKEQLNLDDIDSSNMKTKFKKWCNLFTTSHEERKKMLKHIQKYYKQYYLP